jgi:AcrR family transcriptional regulator
MPRTYETQKPAILDAAVSIARDKGLHNFSRVHVAKKAKVAEATVSHHFGTMPELRTAIVKAAVEREILSILADARAGRESVGVPMSEELRKKVANYIAR